MALMKSLVAVTVLFLFICSGQASQLCFEDCTDKNSTHEISVDLHAQDVGMSLPMDCDCASHTDNCCSHHSVVSVVSFAEVLPLVASAVHYSLYGESFLKAPILEGPFQPPRA